ncbi:transposase [Mycobacterium heckeshornense]|uniref:transposase n=1 Tax=Mycobacterium heckeshornense TaxID=110505 RepID=UPI001FD20665|nr:transposase [Mycobacterium heckeshornense]
MPHDGAVSRVASALGVGWATIMRIVTARGKPLIDDPARLDAPRAIGVDETAFLRATGQHPTKYATGIADLTPGQPARLLEVVDGRSGVVLASWPGERDDQWRAQIATASLDPFRGYASALKQQLFASGSGARPVPCHQAWADRARPGASPRPAR